MSPRVEKSILTFDSEALLQQAIAGLLARMPHIQGVQILQGAQETGKDIVFSTIGPFGESLPCSCVVKNAKITGSVGRSSSARTVLQQIQQSLDTPYVDGSGRTTEVQRVYVVTPFNLGPSVFNSIKGALHESIGRVVFIGGYDLFRLFRTYWPDYFADEAAVVGRYLEEARTQLTGHKPLGAVSTLYDLGDSTQWPQKVYVHLSLSKRLIRYDFDHSRSKLLSFLHKPRRESEPVLNPTLEYETPWSKWHLNELISNVRFMQRALRELTAWGFSSSSSPTLASEHVVTSLESFVWAMQISFNNGLSKEHGSRYTNAEELPANTSCHLDDPDGLISWRERAKRRVTDYLEAFRLDLSSLNSVVMNHRNSGEVSLADRSFLKADTVQRAIDNLSNASWLQPLDSCELVYEDLLSSWSPIHVLIVGPPGSGKTTYCRWHALIGAEQLQTKSTKILPAYVALSQLPIQNEYLFESVIETSVQRSALLGGVHTSMLWSGEYQIRVFLDGLDEIPNTHARRKLMESMQAGVARHKHIQVVATARDIIEGPWLSWLPRLSIKGLSQEALHELTRQWLEGDGGLLDEFEAQLDASMMMREVVTNPLLATLTMLTFRRTGSLPSGIARLYIMFTELLSGGWDLAKGVLRVSKFSRDTKLVILSQLASTVHKARKREFTKQSMRGVVRRAMGESEQFSLDVLEQELLTDGLIERSAIGYQFAHLSFQEFLTARAFVGSPKPSEAGFALREMIEGDDWWNEVIRFYVGLSGHPRALNEWINDEIEKTVPYPPSVELLKRYLREAYPNYRFSFVI